MNPRTGSKSSRIEPHIGKQGSFARPYPLSQHLIDGIGYRLEQKCPFCTILVQSQIVIASAYIDATI
jgi:hypothetical protein